MPIDRELVLPADFDDYAWEVESKGYFAEASVRIGQRVVSVEFYEPVRLAQDVTEGLTAARPFVVARLIVLDRVTRKNMLAAVAKAPATMFL